MTYATVEAVLRDLFGDVGLPEALLCDNAFLRPGTPRSACRLRRLADPAGHPPVHGRPYHPQTQGKVERFHGTLSVTRRQFRA